MAAPTVPAGTAGVPTTFDMTTAARDARWLVIRGARVDSFRGSGAEIVTDLNRFLGVSTPAARNPRAPDPARLARTVSAETLRALRRALLDRGQATAASFVGEDALNRETLRGLLWLLYVHGTPDEGSPATRVWLPNGTLTVPTVGSAVQEGELGVFSDRLTVTPPTSSTPAGGRTPATPTPSRPTGGGSGTPTPTPRPTPTPTGGGQVVTAGVGGGLLAFVAASVIFAGYALATKQHKRGARGAPTTDGRRGGASVMRARLGRR